MSYSISRYQDSITDLFQHAHSPCISSARVSLASNHKNRVWCIHIKFSWRICSFERPTDAGVLDPPRLTCSLCQWCICVHHPLLREYMLEVEGRVMCPIQAPNRALRNGDIVASKIV